MKGSTKWNLKQGRKKILIFHPGYVYPIMGMSQIRVVNQIKHLSKSHEVHLSFIFINENGKKETIQQLAPYCKTITPIATITQTLFFKALKNLFLKKLFAWWNYPLDYFVFSNAISAKQIRSAISKSNCDVFISHYWQGSGFFKYLNNQVVKCIDTHYAVEENIDLYNQGKYDHLGNKAFGRLLQKELSLQNSYFELSDVLILNSATTEPIIKRSFPDKKLIVAPNGQDLDYYLDFKMDKANSWEKTILFYGALSNQFNSKALKRIVDRIFPKLQTHIPDLKLVVLGSNPPEWLKTCSISNIEITGFVEDIRPVLNNCNFALLPLESGSGFRGRTVELLASGIPVIGTHNALDSVGLTSYVNAILVDTDEAIISASIELLQNKATRRSLSENGKRFVQEKYSLESAFGPISQYLLELKNEC